MSGELSLAGSGRITIGTLYALGNGPVVSVASGTPTLDGAISPQGSAVTLGSAGRKLVVTPGQTLSMSRAVGSTSIAPGSFVTVSGTLTLQTGISLGADASLDGSGELRLSGCTVTRGGSGTIATSLSVRGPAQPDTTTIDVASSSTVLSGMTSVRECFVLCCV
jgi:hypothetical protein